MDIPKSGVVIWKGDLCTACGTCELMCSLYHDGVASPARSRVQITYHPFKDIVDSHMCQQCDSPTCYTTCPLADEALCIDELSGARYINEEACTGCGSCTDACPFNPPNIRLNDERTVAFKCDLCRGRAGGPICVEYCAFGALQFVAKDQR
jgi:Fe-S-cluster-containing hydrogenase component 2